MEIKFSHSPKYNPQVDIAEVVSGLAVDITDMLKTGVIHDASGDLDNNGIDDPNDIIGLVRDEFAAMDAARAIRRYGRKAKKEAAKAVEKASEVAAPAPSDSSN